MKHLPKSLALLTLPIIYLITIPLNQPNYSHSIIVLGSLGLIAYLCTLELRYKPSEDHSELLNLQKEYQVEQLKTNIEQIKSNRARQASMRDEFGAGKTDSPFRF